MTYDALFLVSVQRNQRCEGALYETAGEKLNSGSNACYHLRGIRARRHPYRNRSSSAAHDREQHDVNDHCGNPGGPDRLRPVT